MNKNWHKIERNVHELVQALVFSFHISSWFFIFFYFLIFSQLSFLVAKALVFEDSMHAICEGLLNSKIHFYIGFKCVDTFKTHNIILKV